MTTVVNIRKLPGGWTRDPRYVYVGRQSPTDVGPYGNPHRIGDCLACRRSHDRADAIAVFREEAKRRYAESLTFRELVERLRDKTLVCFCAPLPCHGDVYVELLG